MPVCRCSTPYKATVYHVSGPEECRRLEEHLKNETPMPVVCYYEGWEWF